MPEPIRSLLAEIRRALASLYGERLHGVFLFGSRARGDACDESDVDILVVLDEVADYGAEIRRTGELTASLSLRYELSVSRVFVSLDDWRHRESPFLLNVREDAIAA